MPQGNARNRSRKNRNRRRAQQLAAVAESSRNDERRKHEREAFDSAACSKSVRSNDDGANDYVSIDPIRGDDRDESRHRGHEFRPDDKRSIEKIEVKSRPRTVEITTFSSLPLEATIGHIAGVGILETGIRDRAVTVSEPVESPFPEHSRIAKRRSFEADGEGDPWARGDRLEIREVSDSDAEADPTTIEVDSERNSPGGSDVREESEPSDQIRRQIVPRERPSETESLTLKWDTVAPRMMERKSPRKRNSLESAQLPSFFEKGPEEKGSCETFTEKIEEDEPVERMAVLLRRKMRRRAISELHYPSSFLNIIQEEGDRLSEDEAQHIRDFINEEISKYRRESKHSAERTMEGEAEEDDTCGYIATVCENDVSANIDTVENDICVELHPSDAANNSGVFATAVGSAEDIEAEVIQDADSAIKATDSVSFNEPIDVVSSGMQSNSNRIENRTAKGILQRGENEERLASRKPKNNARIDDTPPLYDTNDTNEAQDNELLRKIETIEKSENRKDHNSSFDLQCALHNEATSSRTKQSLPPPLPPKRSSSFGHGLRRLPTSIETEASSSSSVRRLLPTNDGPTNISMRADCKTEKLESSRRPELRECGGPSASRIDRAVYEVDSSDSCEFSPSSSSTVELDDCEGERAGTASKAGYVEPASARVDPSIALSGICDDNPHGVATGAEVTRNCEEGRPAAPAVPSAPSNRQGNETEARANRNDLVKGSFEAGSSNARSPDESSTSDKSYTRPNCSTKDGLETHRRPSDSNDAGKPGREEEESTFSLHHERTVKSETLETRIIERREETTSIDQRTNCCDSNDSSRGLKREERHENPFDFLGSQTAVDIPSVNVNSPPAEVIDPQGPDSSSSTASLSTVRHRPLETSLTDISAIVQEAKDDSFNDEPDESLKWKLTLLKNGESTDTASGECPGSPQPIPYSPVEDLYYVPLNIDFAVEVPEKTSKNALYRTIQQRSPSPLRELCVKKILSMPFGSQIISEITTSKLNIFEGLRSLQRFVSNVPSARRDNVRLNPHGVNEPTPSDMAGLTKTSSAHESPRPNDFENAVSDYYVKMPEGEVNIETRLSNAEGELERGNWKCLSTSKDPRLLVCLSPSQQATSVRTSADALLDLHQKFLKRYSYRDEQPHRAPLLQYRVQVCPTTKEDDDDDDDDANGASTRCNAAVGISSNRLLEIIKEHSPSDPDLQNGTLADRQPEMVNDSSNSSYAFERKEHPDAARPDDRTSRANRRDRAAVNELFLAAARSEDDKPGHAIPGYQSRIAPRPIVEVKYRRSNDNTMIRDPGKLDVSAESFAESSTASNSAAVDRSSCDVAAKRAAPWRTTDFGRHVNPALIDDKLEVPPLPKRAVTVDRSCIDVTSIFDQSPLVLPKERETTEEVIKRMATAEIMDQLRRLQTETSQRLDGSRRSSLPQGCFAQQLRYIEALEEQLKNAILAEEEEQRKAFEELQMHVRRTKQHDDAKTLSPAGTHEEDAWWEINATPECECETRIDDRNRIAGGKRAGNKQDERQGSVGHLGRAYRIDSEIRMESRQGRSSNSGNDYRQGTGIIDGTHDRQFSNEISLERGVYEEELPGNIEDRECRAASEKGNVGALENGASKFHEKAPGARRVVRRTNEITKMLEGGRSIGKTMRGNVYNDVKSQRDTTLPTNGEAFRQRMYDEYMRKMLERQERKNHKVVKISSHETSTCRKMSGKSDDMSAIAKEFIEKARSRLCKSDHDGSETDHEEYRDDSDGTISAKCLIDGEELEDIRKLPKHLREFLKISAIINDEGGVWSPGQTLLAEEPSPERTKEPQRDGAIPPVWIPVNAGASPIAERKEFRPVPFESPVLSRRKQPKEEENTPPWENEGEKRGNFEESRGIYESSTSRIVNSHSAPSQGLNTLTSTPRLPRAQNPTITLLQKAREGQLPKGAAYLERSEFADNRSPTDEKPLISPGEIIYIAKKEYEPETENEPPKRMADSGARKFEGIGPVTKEGIPLVLRSEVKESNQAKWYKRMYQSLHRADRHDDYVTVRYKQKRGGRYGYGSSSGYLSEPEPRAYSDRSVTVDSRRRLRNKENDFTTATMPRRNGALRYSTEIYKNQPGRIEDYEPGHSSIAEKEAKEWWDEVMDIFDGPFDQRNARTVKPYTLPHGLKESGYESDSTLVFRRREDVSPLSLLEQRLAYKTVQSGGDVPLHGLRKPAPERPKESPRRYVDGEVTIHYRSPVRTETKELLSEEELARRSAENMRRVYQEERRRKYLQELHDIDSRRHTDNFTPSQKSPIPLNRYDDFVDDLSRRSRSQDQTPEPRLVARALYNFVGQSSRELTFRRGDIIFVRRQVDKNWYEGEYNAMIGLFPFNYVEILPYDGMRTTPKKAHEGQARAKFNFVAQTNLELSLAKGELVVLTRRVDENWYEGRIGNRTGIFPASYVEVVTEPGHRSETTVQNKPVASPAAHSLLANSSSGGKMSMGPHHYVPSIPVNINTIQPSYNSLPRMGGSKLHVSQLSETLHIDTHSEPIPYRALYNYKPQNDDELELKEGDTVYVMEKCDDGWYVGSSQRTGYFGTFPGNYVDRL